MCTQMVTMTLSHYVKTIPALHKMLVIYVHLERVSLVSTEHAAEGPNAAVSRLISWLQGVTRVLKVYLTFTPPVRSTYAA